MFIESIPLSNYIKIFPKISRQKTTSRTIIKRGASKFYNILTKKGYIPLGKIRN